MHCTAGIAVSQICLALQQSAPPPVTAAPPPGWPLVGYVFAVLMFVGAIILSVKSSNRSGGGDGGVS